MSATERTRQYLREMDGLFAGFRDWLEGQYDPQTGGYFYARSSKGSGWFAPDIESSAQAVNIMHRLGRIDGLGPERRDKLIRFFQSKQEAATGYFYDANPDMREDEVMVGRAIGYSVGALRLLGAKPFYPLPDGSRAAPDYVRSPERYRQWLESIDLCHSWRGCDRLCNSAPYLAAMPEGERAPYVTEALSYFGEIQDQATGLWGEGSWYVRLSGTFKLLTFYRRFGEAMPRTDKMYDSLLHTLRTQEAHDMCYIRNPIDLLGWVKPNAVPPMDMEEIVSITVRNMARLLRRDGGFSRELDHSPAAPNVAQVKEGEYYPAMPKPVPLGLGCAEGDMNAGTQAILIRWTCYALAGLDVPPLD